MLKACSSIQITICLLQPDPISHRPISTLPFVPHPQQRWVAGVHEIDDPQVGLAGVLAVQASGVLLQSAFPGNWHGQYQRIEWRVIEAFSDEFARGQLDARRVGRQSFQFRDECGGLLL